MEELKNPNRHPEQHTSPYAPKQKLEESPKPKQEDTTQSEPETKGFKADFMRRVRSTRPTRWVRFVIVSVIFLAFCIWLDNLWVGLVWFLLFDIYITGYIPLTWWKKSKSKSVKSVMAWVDAIVYALILVYFIFAFVGQNYKIPSSSLEKTLLTGDYLWVNKMVYGPRVPQTPLHFPLAQHTLPLVDTKSYSDLISLDYHRLPGLRNVERYDIVVFNAPCADTVATLRPEPDYYHEAYNLHRQGIADPLAYMKENPQIYGDIVVRPVDRRENFVKRAVGLPGDRLQIKDDIVYINGKALTEPQYVQHNYVVPVSAEIPAETWQRIGVSLSDVAGQPVIDPHSSTPFYYVPLTAQTLKEVEQLPQVMSTPVRSKDMFMPVTDGIFPVGGDMGWSLQDMGEFWIPKQGSTLRLTLDNLPIYRRAIETYEGNKVEVKNGKIYINGKPADHYTFKMDYYWMMGDNRDNSSDSRFWGFVPEDHIVGTPMTVLISFDEERPLTDGKIRWNRILRTPNPDK